jgi:transposase-like protein
VCRHTVGDRWYVDETYVKVAGRWRYVYRAIDQYGQITDVYVSPRRDTHAARRFFTTALRAHGDPAEVVTDRAWTLRAVINELIPAFHNTEQYANNQIEADHGQLKSQLPMRGLKRDCSARVVMRGHAFRTSGEATTNSGSTPAGTGASPPRSPNSPERSERIDHRTGLARTGPTQRNRAAQRDNNHLGSA